MATNGAHIDFGPLIKALGARNADDKSDGHLLEQFLNERDEAAFAVLVRRHAAMVLGVCRRILGNQTDADDAFQATFIVLVRKANSLTSRSVVGDWLHGVARRTALKARSDAARRRAQEQIAKRSEVSGAETRNDWLPLLDEELSRLPEKYRLPIVLCDLEGNTRQEAAKRLGWPEGTVASRLVRGRALLAKRLIRSAQVFSGVVAMTLANGAVQAALPSTLVQSTVRAAVLVAAGKSTVQSVVSAQALTLAQGVIQSMLWNKLKLGVFALSVAIVCGIGLSTFSLFASDAGTPPAAEKKAPPQDPVRQEGPGPGADAGPMLGADTGKPIRSLPGHNDRVTSAAYSLDGRWIATASWDGTARVWDAQTGKEVRRLDVPAPRDYNPAHLSRILFSPNNEYIVVAQQAAPNEAGVIVWNRRTGEKVHEFPGGYGSVAVSPDGRLIACAGSGRGVDGISSVVRLYELATGKPVRELRGLQDRIEVLTFFPDGQTLISTGPLPRPQREGGPERLGFMPAVPRFWDVATGKKRRSVLNGQTLGGLLTQCLALSPDGRTLAVRTALLEMATGGRRALLTGHTDNVCAAAFSPDGRTLATGGMDGTVRLWDLPSGKQLGHFGKTVDPSKGGWVLAVAFSPDGRTLVSGGLDVAKGGSIPSTADIWDVSRITQRPRISAERSPAELEADWKDLAADSAAGYAVLGRLVSSPKRGVLFLEKQLQSAKPVDTKRIERLIADLDDGRFQIREKAAKELEALTDRAAPTLRKALAGSLSLEAKRRVEALLDRLEGVGPSAETIREVRVVEALDWIGNAEARRLLGKLAMGPPDTRLTQEAKAAAERLRKR